TPLLQYDEVKKLYGEMHHYLIQIQQRKIGAKQHERLQQLVVALRNGMYAAKNIKDAMPDIHQLGNSSNDIKYEFYLRIRKHTLNFLNAVHTLLMNAHSDNRFQSLQQLLKTVQSEYADAIQTLYREGISHKLTETEISTLFNFNREMITACKSVVYALKDFLLNAEEANYFDELPGFIR
ncbi:MAG: hypothetical protein ACO3BD_04320, partial [Chitinophagaceae bacterium]